MFVWLEQIKLKFHIFEVEFKMKINNRLINDGTTYQNVKFLKNVRSSFVVKAVLAM